MHHLLNLCFINKLRLTACYRSKIVKSWFEASRMSFPLFAPYSLPLDGILSLHM